MRILLVNTLYRTAGFGGAEISVDLLARGLGALGHEVGVLCLDHGASSEQRHADGVTVFRRRIPNLYWPYALRARPAAQRLAWHCLDTWNPFAFRQAGRVFGAFRPDLVVSNVLSGFSTAVWSAARRSAVPVVHVLRDFYLLCTRVTQYRGTQRCQRACAECRLFSAPKRRQLAALQSVVGISRFVLGRHEPFLPPEVPRRVIPNAALLPAANVRLPRSAGPLRIGVIGRFAPEKGIPEFVAALGRRPDLPVRLIVAGDGDARIEEQLRVASRLDPRVEWRGRQAPSDFYPGIDLLAVPSRWDEPFGRIIIEAHSYGAPVLARSTGGMPELIDSGRTGWTFDTDEAALEQVAELARYPHFLQDLRSACRAHAERHTPERVAATYCTEVFEPLLRRKGAVVS